VRRIASRVVAALICSALACAVLGGWADSAGASTKCLNHDGCVLVLRVSGLVDPVIVDFVEQSVDSVSRSGGYVATVVEIDSDGATVSDAELTRFVRHLRHSDVPTTAWVGTGEQVRGAASELVTALPHSAMAALSRIGEIGDQRLPASEFGQEMAGPRSVMRTGSISAGRARDLGVVSRAVPTLQQYVATLKGVATHSAKRKGKTETELDSSVVFSKPEIGPQALHTIASPAVTYLLLAVGIGLLLFEFFTAGVGVAGIIGAGAALGAGYGLGVLPFRAWALVLLILAGVAFGIDIQAGVPRVWTVVGMSGWIIGSFWLFDGVHLPYPALATGLAGMAVAMISGMPAMVRARFGTPTIGRDWMIGETGEVTTAVAPDGVVVIRGAQWRARTNRATPLAVGDIGRVVAIDGLTLEVEPEEGGARDHRERRASAS
jgi:membrane-bound serine protease (ClpP class)